VSGRTSCNQQMRIIHAAEELKAAGRKVCLGIGFFDGVHLGHQQIIRQTITDARQREAIALVITFDRHPSTVVRAPRISSTSACNGFASPGEVRGESSPGFCSGTERTPSSPTCHSRFLSGRSPPTPRTVLRCLVTGQEAVRRLPRGILMN